MLAVGNKQVFKCCCAGVNSFPLRGSCCVLSLIFLPYFQILTPTLVWWLELPLWTPWCQALASCLRRSPRTYQLSKRSSTARAAPCSLPTPVSNAILITFIFPLRAQQLPLKESHCDGHGPLNRQLDTSCRSSLDEVAQFSCRWFSCCCFSI